MLDLTQIALIAVFASVALLAGAGASLVLSRNSEGRRRLREVTQANTQKGPFIPEVLPLSGNDAPGGFWEDLEGLLPRSKKEMTRLRTRLQRAGVEFSGAPALISIAEIALPFLLAGAVYAVGYLLPPMLYLAMAAAAAAGFFLPGVWIERRLKQRRRQIENGLPDALDLLVVCIEAGSGLDQAIVKTSEEIVVLLSGARRGAAHPEFRDSGRQAEDRSLQEPGDRGPR